MGKPGRPTRLNREEAVHSAMLLFWERGYEGTTLEALLEAMGGIKPPSFYNAFGSKEALFREAADYYNCTFGSSGSEALEAAPTVRQGIAEMLRFSAETFTRPGHPSGCLLMSATAHCAPANGSAEAYVAEFRHQLPKTITARLSRAVAEGDLNADADVSLIAAYYAVVVHGLAQRASDGENRETLRKVAEHAMDAWEGLVKA
jgi:AcrR family transcriptional regulator